MNVPLVRAHPDRVRSLDELPSPVRVEVVDETVAGTFDPISDVSIGPGALVLRCGPAAHWDSLLHEVAHALALHSTGEAASFPGSPHSAGGDPDVVTSGGRSCYILANEDWIMRLQVSLGVVAGWEAEQVVSWMDVVGYTFPGDQAADDYLTDLELEALPRPWIPGLELFPEPWE